MAAIVSYHCLSCSAFAVSLSIIICLSFTEAQRKGFSNEIIHRDSPKSPFYNPNETPYQRLANAFHRSINRLHRFEYQSQKTPQIEIIPDQGDYLMKISIGTPPVDFLVLADTGSDLIWTQCKPCTQHCYKQDSSLFDPEKSSTYKDLSCLSQHCDSCSSEKKCSYSVFYGDGSFSKGKLGNDTLTLGSKSGQPLRFPEIVFGCGHNNNITGSFDPKTTGIVGLGGGSCSLISQLGTLIEGKFSYCLVSLFSEHPGSSKMNFGSNALVSGSGVVSTPLTTKHTETFYFLTLQGIIVGTEKIVFNDSSIDNSEGNIIVDTGTTFTFLPNALNSQLLSVLASFIEAKPIPDPSEQFNLCYNSSTVHEVPEITVLFSGANVKLSTSNYYFKIGADVACFNFIGMDGIAIYGNLMQANFLIGYDLEKHTVSFKPTDCSKE